MRDARRQLDGRMGGDALRARASGTRRPPRARRRERDDLAADRAAGGERSRCGDEDHACRARTDGARPGVDDRRVDEPRRIVADAARRSGRRAAMPPRQPPRRSQRAGHADLGRERRRASGRVCRGVAEEDQTVGALRHRRRRAHPASTTAGEVPRMFEQELLAERARLTPDKTAIVSAESGERLTYAQLDERACRFAEMLRRNGVGPGDRFGILAYNSIDYVALFFAAGKADAIVVPLSTRATQHELQQIVNDCGMKWLWHDDDFASMPLSLPGGDAAPRSGTAEDIDCLLYTSGTTGKPKGVMIPRRQLYWNGVNTAISWGLRDDDVSTVHTPLYHAGGIAAFLIPIFTAGGTMVVHKTFNASAVWRTIERERATVVLGVPTIWKLMMEAPECATANLEHVRWFISGGAPLPVYIAEAYAKRGVAMKQGYGLTEVGVNCFSMTVEESVRKRGTIGKPMLFTDVRLVDGEQG